MRTGSSVNVMAPPDLPLQLAVAGEDEAHHCAVTTLTDRLLSVEIEWLDGILESGRTWRSASSTRQWFPLGRARKDASKEAFGPYALPKGHFSSVPGSPDARLARAQLQLFWKLSRDSERRLDVVFIARDLDGRLERLAGLRQAVTEYAWPFLVLLAWFQPEAEAWYIAGHVPRTDDEREAHAEQRRLLGFCPIQQPHRLNSTDDDSVKDAKRVWAALNHDGPEGNLRSLQTDLEILRKNGADAGLADFLDQVLAKLVPLFNARGQ